MSNRSGLNECVEFTPVTVSFAEKFMGSAQFQAVFREGMALVEEAASYLDSTGRKESRQLESGLGFAYATESMRLTTRLMQLASWLLIKRAVSEGEMTDEQALEEEQKLNFYKSKPAQRVERFSELPAALRELVDKSFDFHRRMLRIDEMMKSREGKLEASYDSPLGSQMARLEQAFSKAG